MRVGYVAALASVGFIVPGAVSAQARVAASSKPVPAKRQFLPADFVRFAPKTALDMLVQLPGSTIRSVDQERGLGQASENVLINGQRVANKSGGAVAELGKVAAANVVRIELVDAASLGISGLSGEVANVIVAASRKASGQFEWTPQFRAHYARPRWFAGSASYSGHKGPVDYTFSVKDDTGRGGLGGAAYLYDGQGKVIERREEVFHAESDLVTMQGKFAIDGPGSSIANLTLAYTPYFAPNHVADRRFRSDGDDRARTTSTTLNGYYIDLSGDYEFAAGPGRLKLIGLRHSDHEPVVTTQVTRFASGAPDQGIRLSRDSRIGESVARAEYGWKGGRNDWQVSMERAFNSLDQRGSLFALSPSGSFDPIDFPGGSGKVVETRYEGIVTLSRPLSSKLDLQLAGGGEISKLDRVDGDVPARKFFRPKGSVTLGWRPRKGWDASLKLRRRVGQISFYDFLEQPNLSQDRESSGNPDLVPPQSWEAEGEVGRDLGRWGKARLTLFGHRITDIIDIIPIGEQGQAIGNLPSAHREGGKLVTTLLGEAIGWNGAKLDTSIALTRSRVDDPLTGESRPISGNDAVAMSLGLRQDVPHTKVAWGVEAQYQRGARRYFLTEVYDSWEGPVFASIFVEHKDLFGLTVRGTVTNFLNARHRVDRTVYNGRRNRDPLAYHLLANQLIGPIFSLSIKGNF